MNAVDGPNMVRVCRPHPDDRTVLMVKPMLVLMLLGNLKAFFVPQSVYLLMVNPPTFYV